VTSNPSGPVTFGQLSMLRSYEYLGPEADDEGHLMQIYPTPGVDLDRVQEAWREMTTRHESLRTIYPGSRDDPRQEVLPVDPADLDTVTLPDDSFESAYAQVRNLDRQRFDVSTEVPYRAVVAMHAGRPVYLLLSVHHIAVDLVACAVLEKDFGTLLGGGAMSTGKQPIQLAIEQRTALAQRTRTLEYWADAWTRFVDEDRDGTDVSERSQAALYSEAAMRAADQLAAALTVSVQSVVLAATALSLFRLKDRSAVTLGLMAANRLEPQWQRLVTSMNQLAPLTISASPDTGVDDFIRDVYSLSLEAYSHGCYSVDELTEYLTSYGLADPDPMNFDCFFNFAGDSDEPPAAGSPITTTVVWQEPSYQTGPTFNLIVETGQGLQLSLRASRNYLPPDLLVRCLTSIEAALVDIARNLGSGPSGTAGPGARTLSDVDTESLRPTPEAVPA